MMRSMILQKGVIMTAKAGKKVNSKAQRDKEARKRLVSAIRGKYSWIPYSSEDFNRDKRREIALEDRA
jgi:hypothetical protein